MSDKELVGVVLVLKNSLGTQLLFRYPPEATANAADGDSRQPEELADFASYKDETLTHVCVVKTQRCGFRFHVEINNLAFIGFPVQFEDCIQMNLVFCTRANLPLHLVDQFASLAHKAVLMLRQEASVMDDISLDHMLEDPDHNKDDSDDEEFGGEELAWRKCGRLSQMLQQLSRIQMNPALTLQLPSGALFSFQFHRNPLKTQSKLKSLAPYHALVPSQSTKDLVTQFPPDHSTAIERLVAACCASKPLYQAAADADLTLSHAMKIASHLVHWKKAKLVYPVCQNKVYLLRLPGKSDVIWLEKQLENKLHRNFASFIALCGTGPFDINVIHERLSVNDPLDWTTLREFICLLLRFGYATQLHNYPLHKSFVNRDSRTTSAGGQKLSFQDYLDGSSHVDGLAYRLNMSISRVYQQINQLADEVTCCYRLESE